MIKFQIIIEKKGVQKKIKPFLGKTMSSLTLVLSVLVLSTLIGLGIHLVFAAPFTNPTADPPLENVEGPINVSGVAQTKGGVLYLLESKQKDKTWEFLAGGDILGVNVGADGNIIGLDIEAKNDLLTAEKIYAPNQNWEQKKLAHYRVPGGRVWCDDGWFLIDIEFYGGAFVQTGTWCAAPFVKVVPDTFGGGGHQDFDERWHERAIAE